MTALRRCCCGPIPPAAPTPGLCGSYQSLCAGTTSPTGTVDGGIGPPLGQLLNMLLLGDYLSYYLAILRGVDPSPNPTITEAKELLERYRDE